MKRITYAQEKLLKLSEERKLKEFCIKNNIDNTLMSKIALGTRVPTYKLMCETCDIIAPAEWIYYTDEKIPYKVQTLPKWDCDKPSYFIALHKKDYTQFLKYDLPKDVLKSLFVTYRLRPTFPIIREFAKEVDPIQFFCDSVYLISEIEYPDTGDIIKYQEQEYFVITDKKKNQNNNKLTACRYEKKEVLINEIITLNLNIVPERIKSLEDTETEKSLKEIKNYLFK